MGSFQFASQGLATVLSALFGAGLSTALTPQQLAQWGWRVPFVFGLLLGPIGWYVRRSVAETPEFEKWAADRKAKKAHAALCRCGNCSAAGPLTHVRRGRILLPQYRTGTRAPERSGQHGRRAVRLFA